MPGGGELAQESAEQPSPLAETAASGPVLSSDREAGLSAESALTVLLPVHNEANSIEQVLTEFWEEVVRRTSAKVLICEDGSTDGTDRVLQDLALRYPMRFVTGANRKGYADAVQDGLEQVDTSFVFFADSDGQYYPEDFWKLWPHVGDYDMVIGCKINRDEPWHRFILSRGFHLLAKIMTGVSLKDMDCGFRVLRREVATQILPEVGSLPFSFWAEFTILAETRGVRITEVPVSHKSRNYGTTSIYTLQRLPLIVLTQILGLATLSRRLKRNRRKA